MKLALIVLLSLMQTNSSKRILDVFGKDANDNSYAEQLRILNADPKGINERDIVIRKHLGAPAFKVVLTGKDGGQKYTSDKVITLEKLYGIIDAMPMRRDEMQNH